jgi:hypothetical protein
MLSDIKLTIHFGPLSRALLYAGAILHATGESLMKYAIDRAIRKVTGKL